MADREIINDYTSHRAGDREVVSWTRPDGRTYFKVPIMYLREVTEADYLAAHPHMRGKLDPARGHFWEVSVD